MPRSLERLLEGSRQKMLAEWGSFARAVEHGAERGAHNEATLRRTLRTQLPMKFGIGSGFVEVAGGEQSSQQDIIVYDAWNNAPLYEGDDWGIYPVEIVRSTVEVKTTLDREGLRGALDASAKLRNMARTHRILLRVQGEGRTSWARGEQTDRVAPRTFIFAYECQWRTLESMIRAAAELSVEHPQAHIHGLCVLNRDWFLQRKVHDNGTYQFTGVEAGGWQTFLLSFFLTNESLDTPHIVDRTAYLQNTAVEGVETTSPTRVMQSPMNTDD
jgi:hypothetical protein